VGQWLSYRKSTEGLGTSMRNDDALSHANERASASGPSRTVQPFNVSVSRLKVSASDTSAQEQDAVKSLRSAAKRFRCRHDRVCRSNGAAQV